jgi:hypothetical protein
MGVPFMPFEGTIVKQAMKSRDTQLWKDAIIAKLLLLQKTKTYTIVKGLPIKKKSFSAKWVLHKKYNIKGLVERFKAHLICRGFKQVYKIDYFNMFAFVARYTTLRFILALAALKDLEIDQLDVDTAFLNLRLEEEIYMDIP